MIASTKPGPEVRPRDSDSCDKQSPARGQPNGTDRNSIADSRQELERRQNSGGE